MSGHPVAPSNPERSQTVTSAVAASEGCPACDATGYDEQTDECCPQCHGTGAYSGIPDASGRYGVDAVYVETDQETSDPRRLVCLHTFTSETALTGEGAEELIARLCQAVREIGLQDAEAALAAALAAGERPLQSIRDELGPRAFNCLARHGVLTIEQAAARTDEELLCIVNLGVTSLERIRSVVGHTPGPEASDPA